MRLSRLKAMSFGELTLRGRQEASKWLDRMAHADDAQAPARRTVPRSTLASSAFASLLRGAVDDAVPGLLAARLPEAQEAVRASAEETLEGRFDLLGFRGLSFGDPIDWHLDPVSGRRAPRVHWSRLDALDPRQVGDSKVVWELGRMQWLVGLGQAYRLSGEERFASFAAQRIQDFLGANPPGVGIHWASSLECAMRILSWSWALGLMRGAAAWDDAWCSELLAALEDHARHVERFLSVAFSPNTHLTGEALGLFYAGLLCPGFERARQWRSRGLEILLEESHRQILGDGIYFEQATCYQRYTAEMGLHVVALARQAGLELPGDYGERLQLLLDALLALRRPDGGMPAIGDADGGWMLPFARRAPDDLRGVFALAAALFERADYAWAAGGPAPELLWLLGASGLAAFDALTPRPPAVPPSRLFPEGGYAVMAGGWEPDAHQLILDVGPLGCPISAGHGHADLLSLQLSAFGEAYVVDPGTYAYTADAAWRDHFRSTAAHSTVVVDGQGQARPAGPFAWRERPAAHTHRWLSTPELDFADAHHAAYARLADPVRHRRRVLFVKPRYFLVADDLEGAAEHHVELRFQFSPRRASLEADGWVRVRGALGRGLLVLAFAQVPLEARLLEGGSGPAEGWVAPDYGRRCPAPVLIYSAVAKLPLRILTLLLPCGDVAQPAPRVTPLWGAPGEPVGVAFENGERAFFEEDDGRLVGGHLEGSAPSRGRTR